MKYYDWEILREAGHDKSGAKIAECRCKCGIIKFVQIVKSKPISHKCSNCRKKDAMKKKYIGMCFGNLQIIDQIPGKKSICKCQCGTIKTIRTSCVVSNKITSCGCLRSVNRVDYLESVKKRILSNIDITEGGCWEWRKSRSRQGYGQIGFNRKTCLLHRVSWTVFVGPLDKDILVLHKCDNPPCCNPEHLFLGTDKDNILDAFAKGRIIRKKGEQNYHAKLKEENIIEIRVLHEKGLSFEEIGKIFYTSRTNVRAIVNRKAWKHVQ